MGKPKGKLDPIEILFADMVGADKATFRDDYYEANNWFYYTLWNNVLPKVGAIAKLSQHKEVGNYTLRILDGNGDIEIRISKTKNERIGEADKEVLRRYVPNIKICTR